MGLISISYENLVDRILSRKGEVGVYAGYEHVTSLTETLIRRGEIISTVRISYIPEDYDHDEYYLTVDGNGIFCIPIWNVKTNQYCPGIGENTESYVHGDCRADIMDLIHSPFITPFLIAGENDLV